MKKALSMPMDVKLMNMTASVLSVAFACLVVAAVLGWAWRHPLFAIRGIAVVGDVSHNNAMTIRANVTPKLSGTLFSLDLDNSRQAFEALPWVRKAIVHRQFPSGLKVQLQEHKAVAYWGAEGESTLLNSYGEVFDANTGEVEQDFLPRLNGSPAQAAQVLAMYQMLAPLFESRDLAMEQFELTGHGGWRARLDTGAVVEFGNGGAADVLARTQRFLQTLTQATTHFGRKFDALESADLRHEDGYAIRLRGVTTLVADVQKK